MFHFHGVNYDNLLTNQNVIAGSYHQREDRGLHRRANGSDPFSVFHPLSSLSAFVFSLFATLTQYG